MKNFKIYTLSLICFLAFSCGDILDESPTTFYDEATVYSSENGVETAVNGLYYILGSFNYYGSAYQNLMMPVSGMFWSSQVANIDATGLNTTTSNQNLSQMWTSQYQLINAANVAIDNLENSPHILSNRETALGHAYFLRGHTYSELVRLFGGVPLHTKPIDINDIHTPRATRQEIIDQTISDLTRAKELMPEASKTLNGRPGKMAANVALARLYLFEASKSNGDIGLWKKAHDELLPVIDSKEYELLPTFADLFKPGNENTKESIFELQYGSTGGGRTSDLIRLYTPANSIYAPSTSVTFGRLRPNKEIFDLHLAVYPEDPRLGATHLYNTYPKSNGGNQNIYPKNKTGNQGFTAIAKWFDPTYNGSATERNYIMMRYADVLLMMAEIVNEMSGPEAAYPYINEVLARARDTDGDGMSDTTDPVDYAGLTQDQFRDRIMQERIFELLSEGQEWYDTRRRGYDYLLNNIIIPHNSNPTFDASKDFMYPDNEKNLLLPIPLSEISGNQMIGPDDQNPGY